MTPTEIVTILEAHQRPDHGPQADTGLEPCTCGVLTPRYPGVHGDGFRRHLADELSAALGAVGSPVAGDLTEALRRIAGPESNQCSRLVPPYACRLPNGYPEAEWCDQCIAAAALAPAVRAALGSPQPEPPTATEPAAMEWTRPHGTTDRSADGPRLRRMEPGQPEGGSL